MNKRILQINSEIQKALSEIITYELQNPKINGIITVTKVETTIDLDYSKVFISIYATENKQEVFYELRHSAGFLRKELTKKINLKKIPFLQLILDTSFEDNEKIEKLIAETKNN